MNKSSLYLSLLALVVSAVAIVMATKKNDQLAVASANEAGISSVLNENPQIIIDALQKYEQIQREAQAREAAKLFTDNLEAINNDPNTPFVGPEDAKVVLVEFFDFSCGYCKRLAPTIEQIIKANPDIKVVFKPITFVAPISKYAAQAALAADKQGKFLEVYTAMLANPQLLTEDKINEFAKKADLDMDQYEKDVNSEEVKKTIQDVAALAQKLQIHGVPSLVLNGQALQTVDPKGIQAAIDALK